jgi:hypothetical protein
VKLLPRALLSGLLLLASCVDPPPPDPEPPIASIYVVERGWHTDIGLPAGPALGPLAPFEREFPGARYFVFGFGARSYVEAREKTLGLLVRSLFPGEGMIVVTALNTTPAVAFAEQRVIERQMSRAALARLTWFIAGSIAWGADGRPRLVGLGPDDEGLYYASTRRYDLFDTCNTWTARALQAAGEPVVPFGVIATSQLIDQLAPPGPESPRVGGRS